jgi:plasmid stabilization system protein ParE
LNSRSIAGEADAAGPSSEGYSDIDTTMSYYEQVATPELANEFYAELRHVITEAATRPEFFSIRKRDLRRVNLRRFPYHFLFRQVADVVRILVVRHHGRHPTFGVERQ